MRRLIMLVVLATVLAGCSGSGSGLSRHVMNTADLGPGFVYVPVDSEDYSFYFETLKMERNPGSGDPAVFTGETGYNITAVYAAVIEHNATGALVFSAALQFRSAEEAIRFGEEIAGCEPGDTFTASRSGSIVSLHDGEELEEPASIQAFMEAVTKVNARTGGTSLCTGETMS